MCRAPEHSRCLVSFFPSYVVTDFAYHLLPKAQELDMICVETGLGWGVQDRRGPWAWGLAPAPREEQPVSAFPFAADTALGGGSLLNAQLT